MRNLSRIPTHAYINTTVLADSAPLAIIGSAPLAGISPGDGIPRELTRFANISATRRHSTTVDEADGRGGGQSRRENISSFEEFLTIS